MKIFLIIGLGLISCKSFYQENIDKNKNVNEVGKKDTVSIRAIIQRVLYFPRPDPVIAVSEYDKFIDFYYKRNILPYIGEPVDEFLQANFDKYNEYNYRSDKVEDISSDIREALEWVEAGSPGGDVAVEWLRTEKELNAKQFMLAFGTFQFFSAGAKPLPRQGWKIHVSAVKKKDLFLENLILILALDYLISNSINHKVISSSYLMKNFVDLVDESGTQRGKLIAIYTDDEQHFRSIIKDLGDLLEFCNKEEFIIPPENIFSKCISYRYGMFHDTDGKKLNVVNRDGAIIKRDSVYDDRSVPQPAFITWDPLKD